MGDSYWWNERFSARKLSLMCHEKCLEEDLSYFITKGKVLDAACGDGRNSIYLARLGYNICAIDFSEEALKRLNYFSNKENIHINTKLLDLAEEAELEDLEKYDAIMINHYRLKPQLYNILIKSLNNRGILWVNGFRKVPEDNPNITECDILREEDFRYLDQCKLENKRVYEIGTRKFVRYIWRKQ